ncbi:hypothetical protein DL96DRAFT_1786772 [Flagelloscypha sp. PMI_526]|nr:hypothetical protein DL96DRAFT_1786772 [Flagelloscypha sp. PMI_526]
MHAFSFFLAAVSLVSANPLSTRAKTSFSGGDITFYEGGLTACGETINTNSDKTVAVSFNVFDNFPGANGNSNKNPICKTSVKATINGRTQTLRVLDSCEGCKDADLDLTQAAWDGFGVPRSVGRLAGLKWEFIGVGGGDSGNDNDSSSSSSKTKTATKTATKDAPKTATTTSASETASNTPVKAVGGAVDSSDDNTTSDATTTSEAAAVTTADSTEGSSSSSESGDDSASSSSDSEDSSASDSSTSGDDPSSAGSSSDSNTTAASGTADVSACNDAWTACNAKFTGTAEDVANYSCQTEYVDCVDAALASSSKKRSVSFKRHIARSRLESF